MSTLVTIGIPCFNAELWLRAAIDSALAQTGTPREVIVVDDGSTDASPAIAAEFQHRIQFVPGKHRGGNAARNQILKLARGEWIQFLDADDYLESEKISVQFTETNGGVDADIIYSPVLIETVAGGRVTQEKSQTSPQNDIYAQCLAWHIPQTGGALWRKAALEKIGGWNESQPCCQEHELYLRALKAGLRFVYAATPKSVYRVWSEETVCRKDPELVIREKTKLIDELRTWMTERNLWAAEHHRIAGQVCFEMARTLAKLDLAKATAYHNERKSRGLMNVEGPAAPNLYRFAYRTIGFRMAENIAAARRND